jgi:hypothetical protein
MDNGRLLFHNTGRFNFSDAVLHLYYGASYPGKASQNEPGPVAREREMVIL